MSRQSISIEVELRIRLAAGYRCGYCLTPQKLLPWELELEHIEPKACGGASEENNLWLSCRSCNSFKAPQTHALDPVTKQRVPLFNPRQQEWKQHFKWSDDGATVVGLTDIGRATVIALKLNNIFAVTARQAWIEAGWHPPQSNS